ncbi:hypothetical protein [Gottfriedia luciferensis]|uniref:hypothetical protein n=1 Tax=Gottfriedia luciferensis TaxID=178774 RepID=UPI000B45493F|nr:hypothetical protein [Gottfriedia luciferensis]
MGYIPPLHYSAFNHYVAQSNKSVSVPFLFKKVQKTSFPKGYEESHYKNVVTMYRNTNQSKLNDDVSIQKILSEITGIGRVVNLLV